MAGRIRSEDIELLKQRADIVSVVSDHTQLARAGQRLKGLCPFHEERTPSFTVDPGRNVYHCFGCGEGGDVYSFLQKIEGLTFVDAVEQLARRTGYTLHYEELTAGQRRTLGERSQLVKITTSALEWFREQLDAESGAVAREYLDSRGFDREVIDKFKVGFAPLEWEDLSRHLAAHRVDQRDLIKAGIAKRNNRGGVRDVFRGRVIFPVCDLNGDAIGFGGRVLPGLDYGEHDPPKYLNSPETPLYRKSRVLYGIDAARPGMSRQSSALICEGYTDVMALHASGIDNAVATCGTAVGDEHLRMLSKYVKTLVLAFDSDEAGGKAAERAWQLSQPHELEVKVLELPAGQDPADVVNDEGAEGLQNRVGAAVPVIPFMLRRIMVDHDVTSDAGRAAATDAAAVILAATEDPVLRARYAEVEVAEPLQLSIGVVAQAVARHGAEIGGVAKPQAQPARRQRQSATGRTGLEKEVLRIALQHPSLLPDAFGVVEAEDWTHDTARAIFQTLIRAGGVDAELDALIAAAPDDVVAAKIRELALDDIEVEPDREHVAVLINRLLLLRVSEEIDRRKSELERLNPTVDADDYKRRFEALVELEARRRELVVADP